MIVNRNEKGLLIIYHAAHGLLAGKIANEIADEFRPKPWFETLIAVTEHDDRQLNFKEKDYLSNVGIPLDFTEEKKKINDIVKRIKKVVESADKKSGWTRLFISYHVEFLYGNLREESKRIKKFFDEEEIIRDKILGLYQTNESTARDSYEFLRFCDRLSLILCNNTVPNLGRKLEINTSIAKKTYFISKVGEGVFNVNPWIFKSDSFTLSVEQRHLDKIFFSSESEFKSELEKTNPSILRWQFIKA